MPEHLRARDLGIRVGRLEPGPLDAITDVAGVAVGHATLIAGDGRLVVGSGPVRTGVTLVIPPGGGFGHRLFAGIHRLNGNGEMTGAHWIADAGLLISPVALTNTHSVGAVHEAMVALELERGAATGQQPWALPVVAETWDGLLNDIDGFHVRAEHVRAAFETATGGPVEEGNVGGGTGMICHRFKGGIGTASRVVELESGAAATVGVLVQANYGRRERLTVAGVPVGAEIGAEVVPEPGPLPGSAASAPPPGAGSIIVVAATDAPLLPHQCARLAQRCGIGIGRTGGAGEPSSGDLVIAFASGNSPVEPMAPGAGSAAASYPVAALRDDRLGGLFWAAIEATEEAIVNALLAAESMTGRDGITAHALPHDLLLAALDRHAAR